MKSVTVYNQQTRLQVWEGNKKGDPILFLHPQGGSSSIWKEILPHFSENYYTVCMDLRGQGGSDRALEGYDIDTQCEDMKVVLDHLHIEKAHLIGNSLGGDFATFFAAKYPERVLSLSQLDSGMINYLGKAGEKDMTKEEVLKLYRERRIPSFAGKGQFVQYARENWAPWDPYYEKWFEHVSVYPLEDGSLTFHIPAAINVQIMETVCDLHYEEAYRQVRCPVLFLPAEAEPKLDVKLAMIERLHAYLTCKAVVIPHSKHLMPIDQPDRVAFEIRAFLQEVSICAAE